MRTHLSTGRWAENRLRIRVSLHLFRWGFHYKLRLPTGTWRHFVVKLTRGSALGVTRGRRHLWIGWWQTRKGVRGQLNGWRLSFYADRLPDYPRSTISIPFFPQNPERRAA